MKRFVLLIVAVLLCTYLVACDDSENKNHSITDEEQSITLQEEMDTKTETNDTVNTVCSTETEFDESIAVEFGVQPKYKISTRYDVDAWWTAESLLKQTEKHKNNTSKVAFCMVTVISIDTDEISDTFHNAALTLRIDDIYSASPSFTCKTGETFLAFSHFINWQKVNSEDGDTMYSIAHDSVLIPITEVGAQYIVDVFEPTATPGIYDFEYEVCSYTIPITDQHATEEERLKQYKKFNCPLFLQVASEDLIHWALNK